MVGGYFSSLFKLLWKIDEFLAKLHPRQLFILGGFEFVQNKRDHNFSVSIFFFSQFSRGQFSSGKLRHTEHYVLVCRKDELIPGPSGWTVLEREKRKKVNLSVNEKQKLWVLSILLRDIFSALDVCDQ